MALGWMVVGDFHAGRPSQVSRGSDGSRRVIGCLSLSAWVSGWAPCLKYFQRNGHWLGSDDAIGMVSGPYVVLRVVVLAIDWKSGEFLDTGALVKVDEGWVAGFRVRRSSYQIEEFGSERL